MLLFEGVDELLQGGVADAAEGDDESSGCVLGSLDGDAMLAVEGAEELAGVLEVTDKPGVPDNLVDVACGLCGLGGHGADVLEGDGLDVVGRDRLG